MIQIARHHLWHIIVLVISMLSSSSLRRESEWDCQISVQHHHRPCYLLVILVIHLIMNVISLTTSSSSLSSLSLLSSLSWMSSLTQKDKRQLSLKRRRGSNQDCRTSSLTSSSSSLSLCYPCYSPWMPSLTQIKINRDKVNKTITDGGSTAPQNSCYQS